VGGRSTAIKLRNGDVWVLASTTLDDPTKSTIDGMGKVKYVMSTVAYREILTKTSLPRYIVAPDTEHNQFLGKGRRVTNTQFSISVDRRIQTSIYPDAKLIGVEPLVAKRKDLHFDGGTSSDEFIMSD
jgi:hypothetical protein